MLMQLLLLLQFDIYCERAPEIKTAISILTAGSLVGTALFGQLSDSYGRKKMLLVCHVGMLISSFVVAQAQTIAVFTILQFLTMIFAGGHVA